MIDLATNDATSWQGMEAARGAFPAVEFLVPPAVRQALASAVINPAYDAETRNLASAALTRMARTWKFTLGEIAPAELAVCGQNAKQIVHSGLVGGHAWHSAHTIAECTCLGCTLLLSHNEELLEIDYGDLRCCLDDLDRDHLWITTPGEILRQIPRG